MTCKDCIHYDVCKALEDQVGMIDARQCGCYKDKSRFIELPCKKGDVLYRNEEKCIADHWNILLTAFNEKNQCRVFDVEEAKKRH